MDIEEIRKIIQETIEGIKADKLPLKEAVLAVIVLLQEKFEDDYEINSKLEKSLGIMEDHKEQAKTKRRIYGNFYS